MYATRLIEQKLEVWEARNHRRIKCYSIGQVQEFAAYIEDITKSEANSTNNYIDVSKRLTAKRQKEIKERIENEQVLCSCDYSYFSSRYANICDEKGDIQKFSNRVSQEIFQAVVAHFEDLEVAIELFVLKARQLGISTAVALMFLHRLMFMPHTQAVMASVQADKSELIGRILNICYQKCPWWLVPKITATRVGKMLEFSNGSILSIQSGMQATGIAQGWTPTAIHISEVGDIPNPKKVIEEGLLRATHPSRKLFQVHEGTGAGNTGWQADTWRALKEDFPLGKARFCPLFLNWPLATDLYPEADWLKKFPIPEMWTPCEDTRKHVRRCELYIRSTEFLSKICGSSWTMPRHQQWYWEFNYLAAVKSHTQRIWMSQMPADDMEALTGKNDLVFAQDVIEVRTAERERNYKAYAIVGNAIDEGFEADETIIDYDAERIVIEWDSHRGHHYEWNLIPLLPFDESGERGPMDKLLVFREPEQGRDYSIGIDTADGLGKDDEDNTVINVTLAAKGNFPDIQMAEFVSNRVNPPQCVGFAAALGAWYGPVCRDPRGAKFIVEQRERPGDDCQLQLKLMGFTYQHKMIRYDDKQVNANKSTKDGWYTNSWSRSILINRFVEAVNNGWYKPNSLWLIRELSGFERKFVAGGKTRLDHQTGKHDDRIWSAAMSYFTNHHLDVLTERSSKVYSVRSGQLPEFNEQYCNSNQVCVDD